MTIRFHDRDTAGPGDDLAALRLRLYYLDRDIAAHEAAIKGAAEDQSPLGRKEIALRSHLLPGLRAERRCVARRLEVMAPPVEPPRQATPPAAKPKPPTYAELQAARRERARRFLDRRAALRAVMR